MKTMAKFRLESVPYANNSVASLHSSCPQVFPSLRVSTIYLYALLSKLTLLACFETTKAAVNLRVVLKITYGKKAVFFIDTHAIESLRKTLQVRFTYMKGPEIPSSMQLNTG